MDWMEREKLTHHRAADALNITPPILVILLNGQPLELFSTDFRIKLANIVPGVRI